MSILRSLLDDARHHFRHGNMVKRLLIVNLVIFVVVQLIYIGLFMTVGYKQPSSALGPYGSYHAQLLWEYVLNPLCMPTNPATLLWHIWSPLTHMFLHQDFFHVLHNMIWLSMFGTIVGDLIGDRRVLPIYILGGLVGAALYFVVAQIAPHLTGEYALGASAAVMAFGGAGLVLAPDYRLMLLFLGEVKLKYIVFFMVLLDLVGVADNFNSGGHVAHIGGFVFGILFVYALRDGKDWSAPVNRVLDGIMGFFSHNTSKKQAIRRPMYTEKSPPPQKSPSGPAPSDSKNYQERLDAILDKIKREGFENLSQEEKDFLYEASKK